MRVIALFLSVLTAGAEPVRWSDLPAALAKLLAEAGVERADFDAWRARHNAAMGQRLEAGAAEHIAYYVLQTGEWNAGPRLNPVAEARRYLASLPAAERTAFQAGAPGSAPLRDEIVGRIAAFQRGEPVSARHAALRLMAQRLGWGGERIMQTAFRFLLRNSGDGDADALYQQRGLSADPFPASMAAVERGLAWWRGRRAAPAGAVLLAGPGAEFGSRFGVDDGRALRSPQPEALLKLLGAAPAVFDCADIRVEVTATLAGGPCEARTADVVSERLPAARYDLAVATNVLVYLDERELGVALGNIARSLRPGGCLLHNDARFAARLFGEAAGIPAVHYESVVLSRRGEREQRDRIAVHCKP